MLLTRPLARMLFLVPVARSAKLVWPAGLLLLLVVVTFRAEALPLGALSQVGCSSETGSSGACIDGKALDAAVSVARSPDGKNVYVASAASDAVAVFQHDPTTGALTQLAGAAGCISDTGSGGECTDGRALDGPLSLAISADGENVYVASFLSDAVAVFQRDATTGQLTQLSGSAGCVSDTASSAACADGKALDGPASVAVSKDHSSVYIASLGSDAVAVFARETTSGALIEPVGTAACVSQTGSGGACADGRALNGARSVAVSGDGTRTYVASLHSDAVAVFARNTSTGHLTQLARTAGCVSETGTGGLCANGKALDGAFSVAVTARGIGIYVASSNSNAVAVFKRSAADGLAQLPGTAGCVSETGSDGTCADGKALDGPRSLVLSARGENVYTASDRSDAVAVFRRNATTDQLTQLAGKAGCVSETGSGGACADGRALDGAFSVAGSVGGKHLFVASRDSDAVAAFRRDTGEELTQLAGTAGCVSQTGTGGACADGRALKHTRSVAMSADGKNLYVASSGSDAVVVFRRNTETGEISQLAGTAGCVSEDGSDGACADGRALASAWSVAVSPDGESVYVASTDPGYALAIFRRNTTTGELSQLTGTAGCVSDTASDGCADAKAIDGPRSVAVSADGKSVYVASCCHQAVGGVAVFRRDMTTGALTQLEGPAGCITEDGSGGACTDGRAVISAESVRVSGDGKSVYVASGTGAVAVFTRNATTGALTQLSGAAGCVSDTGSGGTCVDGKALAGASGVVVSEDGKSVYVASYDSDAVAVFRRNATSGALNQLAGRSGCVSDTGSGGICADGKALHRAYSVAVSADGKSVYATSDLNHAVAVFRRDTTTGQLAQPAGTAGCVSEFGLGGACADGRALRYPTSVTVSEDGKSVYVAAEASSAIAVFGRQP